MAEQNFQEAGRRLYNDADCLLNKQRHATASHLFGLAAECALKVCMDHVPGGDRELPKKHLPGLLNDAKTWLKGRKRRHLFQVINHPDYMHGWHISNRYWPSSEFTEEKCRKYRHDAYQALTAMEGGY